MRRFRGARALSSAAIRATAGASPVVERLMVIGWFI
jgi:hypothetical protein